MGWLRSFNSLGIFRLGYTTLEDIQRIEIQRHQKTQAWEQGARVCNTNSEVNRNSIVEAQTMAGFSGGDKSKRSCRKSKVKQRRRA